ncbi:MAG: hypothetical protein HY549_02835 [Elusimicrobia bacterium]|nr:hypothetical protein [Elusimicrobiota bacterium]
MTAARETIRQAARRRLSRCYVPGSVYRLQLSRRFDFRSAAAVAPYLREMGIEALYLSPCFRSVPGSSHGYDVVDPGELNPELGGEAGFEFLSGRLRGLGRQSRAFACAAQ